jgi:hypothetical protein
MNIIIKYFNLKLNFKKLQNSKLLYLNFNFKIKIKIKNIRKVILILKIILLY